MKRRNFLTLGAAAAAGAFFPWAKVRPEPSLKDQYMRWTNEAMEDLLGNLRGHAIVKGGSGGKSSGISWYDHDPHRPQPGRAGTNGRDRK